jgi:hypothetical protein
MIFLHRARLLILSQPKTGTTALEHALAQRASMAINGPPNMKHVSYRGFMKFIAPWIEFQTGLKRAEYDVVATMREPIDWLGSWYRYRTRDRLKNRDDARVENYTGDVTFEQFLLDVCKDDDARPPYARIKTPSWVALQYRDSIGIDRLYPYEDLSGLYQFIEDRTGKTLEMRQMNVSPKMQLALPEAAAALIREKFAFDFDLHASLRQDGAIDPHFRAAIHEDEEEDYSPGV